MKIHICGICGTFMGGIALLARALGHRVSGSDAAVYPPMSTQLAEADIRLQEGYAAGNIAADTDLVVIGNALSRGNPEVEQTLSSGLPYTSGPQWLGENVLYQRQVLAVAGTHGKTTTSSLLAWLLEDADLEPGFLIGGIAANLGVSARLGKGPWFVIEADEYDTSFFDKRAKFIHYRPNTLILNNLEYDHADIYPDIQAIQRQFHHLIRTVPGGPKGKLLINAADENLRTVLRQGCWSDCEYFSPHPGQPADWVLQEANGGHIRLRGPDGERELHWNMPGRHNAGNALGALAAARHIGINSNAALVSLGRFKGIKRRLEVCGTVANITLYDDFAHHPTAIHATLAALRSLVGVARIIAVVDLRSNSMRMGAHNARLPESFAEANITLLHRDTADNLVATLPPGTAVQTLPDVAAIVHWITQNTRSGDHIVLMSNGAFGGIRSHILAALAGQ